MKPLLQVFSSQFLQFKFFILILCMLLTHQANKLQLNHHKLVMILIFTLFF
nr:MAG TPA: hypothetical protein [Caudoviricetes sp.]DAS34523.1 MAG TPA: hypothetical protein [Bacteriophage sp.]